MDTRGGRYTVISVTTGIMFCHGYTNPNPAAFSDLHSATDLALRATKMTAQAIGRSMASLVVLERYLWLNLTEMKYADKIPFLDSPVSPTGLFGPAVEGFAERFTAAQKAMRHFLPKHSSSAATSSRPKMALTQHPAKSQNPATHSWPDATLRSARDPGPRLCWTQCLRHLPDLWDWKRRGLSPAAAGPPLKKPLLCLLAPGSVPGAYGRVFVENTVVNIGSFHIAPTQPIAVIVRKIKHKQI